MSDDRRMTANEPRRVRVVIRGAVQGVGFRPFVYRLATELGIDGWVSNTGQGVFVDAESDRPTMAVFLRRLAEEQPSRAVVVSRECTELDPIGASGFAIHASDAHEEPSAFVLPDIATCADCLRELFDPHDRRYRYPFINCTNCGPRFSIIEDLPYDRERTSMKAFVMCRACQREYEEPCDRRFHAQPNACPVCGPSLALWNPAGAELARSDGALCAALEAINRGAIVAVKGIGGFLLVADATNDAAVRELRVRKHRDEKPFALLFPDLDRVARECEMSSEEARLLAAPESPIVLLRRAGSATSAIAPSVAPGIPQLGAMLPYAPLHHLLLRGAARPLVATSGNLADEPICVDEHEALLRLSGIADLLLVHDRPIVRHVDDSIVRIVAGREMVLRRARGYAPLPVILAEPILPTLAVGAHLKNAVGVSVGRSFFISQHIGDLETPQACEAFEQATDALQRLYRVEPMLIAADLHPGYASTRYAAALGRPTVHVQHHAAHVAACMAENGLDGEALGVAWDGTGYGTDGTIWGGEFLVPRDGAFERVATLRPFRLPGGARAIREPRRAALGALYELGGDAIAARADLPTLAAFDEHERRVLVRMIAHGLNSPVTTSVGRLFDAVASLCGLCQRASFEGQAAMALEFAIDERSGGTYPMPLVDGRLDWHQALQAVVEDVRRGLPAGAVAFRFHRALIDAIVAVARQANLPRVVLTGGCFQNRFLLEQAIRRLGDAGFRVYWHQRVPTGDGGIALGQAIAASWASRAKGRTASCVSQCPAGS